jgi:hypothetical protein
MLKTVLPYLVAFAGASIVIVVVRLAAGLERGARLAGIGVPLALIAALFFVAGFGWTATGPLNRTGHILIGATVVGAVLAALQPAKALRWGVLIVFVLGCGWASALNGLLPKVAPTLWQLVLVLVLALLWLGMIVRFAASNTHKPTTLVVLIAVGVGLAVVASIAGDAQLMAIALSVVAALFALAIFAIVLKIEVGEAALVPVAAIVVAMAWALSQRHPEAVIGLSVLILVLFAERTARRVPLPKSGIAAYLYMGVLAACCAIPIVIAAILVSAAAKA